MSGGYKAPSNKCGDQMSPKEREMGGEDVSIPSKHLKDFGNLNEGE